MEIDYHQVYLKHLDSLYAELKGYEKVIELEYKLGEDGKPLLDENKKPIPLIEFKKDKGTLMLTTR